MMKKILMMLLAVSFFHASVNYAALHLKIEDMTNGGAAVMVADNDGNDLDTDAGAILSLINSASIKVTTVGTSKPLGANSNLVASLDLNNVVVTSTSAVDLRISLTDTDFQLNPSEGSLIAGVGGTLGGASTAQFDYYYNTSNGEFDTVGAATVSTGTFANGPFSGSVGISGLTDLDNPFSLTQVANLSVAANEIISYDSDLRVVPEPSVLFLLGMGLLGFVGARGRMS